MIEQDLIICRALVSIYSDPFLSDHLAFRGGTALHKLYLRPQPRYSEDIDLVQVNAEPIKETIDRRHPLEGRNQLQGAFQRFPNGSGTLLCSKRLVHRRVRSADV